MYTCAHSFFSLTILPHGVVCINFGTFHGRLPTLTNSHYVVAVVAAAAAIIAVAAATVAAVAAVAATQHSSMGLRLRGTTICAASASTTFRNCQNRSSHFHGKSHGQATAMGR